MSLGLAQSCFHAAATGLHQVGEQRAAALRRARVPARLLPGARCSLPRVLGGVRDWHVPGQCLHVQACDWSIVRCTCMHDEQHQQHALY